MFKFYFCVFIIKIKRSIKIMIKLKSIEFKNKSINSNFLL